MLARAGRAGERANSSRGGRKNTKLRMKGGRGEGRRTRRTGGVEPQECRHSTSPRVGLYARPPARPPPSGRTEHGGAQAAHRYAARISDRKERRTCACETFWSRGRRPRRRRRRHRNPDHRRLRNIADLEFWTAAKISGEWAARSKNLVME